HPWRRWYMHGHGHTSRYPRPRRDPAQAETRVGSLGTRQQGARPDVAISSGRKGASRGHNFRESLTLCSVTQTRQNIFVSQIGKIVEQFLRRHPRGKIRQDVVHSDAHPANTWLAPSFPRFHGDNVAVIHLRSLHVVTPKNRYAPR